MINRMDYVELGLACADICTTLDRGLDGKQFNDLNSSVREATSQLTTLVSLAMHVLSTSLMMLST